MYLSIQNKMAHENNPDTKFYLIFKNIEFFVKYNIIIVSKKWRCNHSKLIKNKI